MATCNIRTYPLGYIQTNCYIVSNATKQCLIFDPGGEGDKLISELHRLKMNPLAIILTHAHFDQYWSRRPSERTVLISRYISILRRKSG